MEVTKSYNAYFACSHLFVLADEGVREVCDGDGVVGGGRVGVCGAEVEGEEEGVLRRREQQHRRARGPARRLHAACKLRYDSVQ